MWTEEETVRFLQAWHRLSATHPAATRTERTALIRPLFMNRSERSVTSKIDLEQKRLLGEQSDPYPQLNALRERVYRSPGMELLDGAAGQAGPADDAENAENGREPAPSDYGCGEAAHEAAKRRRQGRAGKGERFARKRISRLLALARPSAHHGLPDPLALEVDKVERMLRMQWDEMAVLQEYATGIHCEVKALRAHFGAL